MNALLKVEVVAKDPQNAEDVEAARLASEYLNGIFDPITTDIALAAELMATAHWIIDRHMDYQPHVDRLQRAAGFLRGVRGERAFVNPAEVTRLIRNDPFVAAVFDLARKEAIEQLQGETEIGTNHTGYFGPDLSDHARAVAANDTSAGERVVDALEDQRK